ncbi:MAG: dephospho-CoA kinase [Planctomycetota bacterium]|nr:dephospho-CoA kinase [Planctomycetota bacterium]
MTQELAVKKPVVIGIVGGIASGKSEVTRMLGAMNAVIISADEIGHRVLQLPDVQESLVSIFGDGILQESIADSKKSRQIDRKKLGAMVFGDTQDKHVMRKKLEALVHPRIRELGRAELGRLVKEAKYPMVILDAPLLIEGGWLPYCDRVLFVDSPEAMRKQRVMERGWTEKEWRDREAAQLGLVAKRTSASDVLVNDGTVDQLKQRVAEFVASLSL